MKKYRKKVKSYAQALGIGLKVNKVNEKESRKKMEIKRQSSVKYTKENKPNASNANVKKVSVNRN